MASRLAGAFPAGAVRWFVVAGPEPRGTAFPPPGGAPLLNWMRRLPGDLLEGAGRVPLSERVSYRRFRDAAGYLRDACRRELERLAALLIVSGPPPPERTDRLEAARWICLDYGSLLAADAVLRDFARGGWRRRWERWREGSLREPLFSFWFDDGFSGVRAHALPILRAHRLTAATSVCSDFASRRDLFWRCKLSYLLFGPDRTKVAPTLRRWMGAGAEPVSDITLNRFSSEVVEGFGALYERWTSPEIRERHLRLFDDVSGIRVLRDEGWEIANYFASQYPVGEPGADSLLEEQFGRCERFLWEAVGVPSFCRVLPFDRPGRRSEALAGWPLALVEPRANRRPDGPLYRIPAPFCSGRELIPWLRRRVWAE